MKCLNVRQDAPKYDTVRTYVEEAVAKYSDHNAFILKESLERAPYYLPITYRRHEEMN